VAAVVAYIDLRVFLLLLAAGLLGAFASGILALADRILPELATTREYAETVMHLNVSRLPKRPDPNGPGPKRPIRSRVVYTKGVPTIVGVADGSALNASGIRAMLRRLDAS